MKISKKTALALVGRKVVARRNAERGVITGLDVRDDKPGKPAIVSIAIDGSPNCGGWAYLDDIVAGRDAEWKLV